ncbi:MAG TPA: O-antigen ligase family protein [Phototrophicaceae bacterium]|jgi:O-antigen ligase|nr:O-antigen ligase family protein [Phototrophicaceae bacterium]
MATAAIQRVKAEPANKQVTVLGIPINWNDPWDILPIGLFFLSLIATAVIVIFAPDSAKLALLIPVGLVMGLTVVVRPELALIMSIAYTPFESEEFKPLTLPGGLSVAKILGALILGVFFFNIILRERKFRLFDDPQDFAVLLLAGVFLLSGIASFFPAKTWTSVSRMIRMLIYYFAVKNLLSSDRVIRTALWVGVISGGLAGLWGVNDYLQQNAVMIHDVRTGGVYMDPNDYAALAVAIMAIGIHLLEITPQKILKLLIVVCLLADLFGLIVSASRMGFLALGLVMGIFIWRHPQRKLLLILAVFALVVSFPLWPESIRVRFISSEADQLGDNTYEATTEHSTERRASYIVFGVGVIIDHPILGAGYGTFARLYPRSEFARYDNPMTDTERFRLAHNAYLEITVGTGFVGLIAFVLVLVVALSYLHKAQRWAKRGTVFWAAAGGFELALICLMFCNAFLSIEHANYTWISVAMSSVLAYRMREEQAAQTAVATLALTAHNEEA